MRARLFLSALIPLSIPLFLAMAVPGCGGLSGELCDIVCECEHCDDWREEELCAEYEASFEIAEAYACDVEWEDLFLCQISLGKCDEEEANWSVSELGSCSGTLDLATPCMSDVECAPLGGTCNGATCVRKSCAENDKPCTTDAECPFGDDKCEDERKALFECQEDASDLPDFVDLD